jgi:hypothetical protein
MSQPPFDGLPPDEAPPPSSLRVASMLSERQDLYARLARVQAENAKLQAALNRGAAAEVLRSPGGIIAMLVAILLGGAAGTWAAASETKGNEFMGTVF